MRCFIHIFIISLAYLFGYASQPEHVTIIKTTTIRECYAPSTKHISSVMHRIPCNVKVKKK